MLAVMGLHYVASGACVPRGDGRGQEGVSHLTPPPSDLHPCVSQAKNCMKLVSSRAPSDLAKAAVH